MLRTLRGQFGSRRRDGAAAYANGALVSVNDRTPEILPSHSMAGPAQFSMQGVAPGEYVVVAWPSDAEIEYAKPGFLRQYAGFGKTIQVREGARLTVVLDKLLTNKN